MCSLVMQANMKFSSGMFVVKKKVVPFDQLVLFTLKLKFPLEEDRTSILFKWNIRVLKEQNISEG